MFRLLCAVISSYCMYCFWNPLESGGCLGLCIVMMVQSRFQNSDYLQWYEKCKYNRQIDQEDKGLVSLHLQGSNSEAALAVVSPTIHLPGFALVIFAFVTVKILGNLLWCMGVSRYFKPPLWRFSFFLTLQSGVYLYQYTNRKLILAGIDHLWLIRRVHLSGLLILGGNDVTLVVSFSCILNSKCDRRLSLSPEKNQQIWLTEVLWRR